MTTGAKMFVAVHVPVCLSAPVCVSMVDGVCPSVFLLHCLCALAPFAPSPHTHADAPDFFRRYGFPAYQAACASVAAFVGAQSGGDVVILVNATTAVNAVLRSLGLQVCVCVDCVSTCERSGCWSVFVLSESNASVCESV